MDRNTLKSWFRRGLKPLEVQFAAWIDSFWHKDDAIPMTSISNLQDVINSKQDKIVTPNVSVWLATEAYHAADDIYRSYVNTASADETFHKEATYRCKIDTLAGESPETHPEKWVSQGGSVGTLHIDSIVDLRAELNDLAAADVGNQTLINTLADDLAAEAAARVAADALKVDQAMVGMANGVASLGSDQKVPISQIPQALLGATKFKGFWNPITNVIASIDPTLTSITTGSASVENMGWYYICSTGNPITNVTVDGIHDWALGDWVISIGSQWGKIDNTDAVASVNGKIGLVVLTTADIADSPNKRYVLDSDLVKIAYAEQTTNKATSWTTINDSLYPSIKLVDDRFKSLLLGQQVTVGIGGTYSDFLTAYTAGFSRFIVLSDLYLNFPTITRSIEIVGDGIVKVISDNTHLLYSIIGTVSISKCNCIFNNASSDYAYSIIGNTKLVDCKITLPANGLNLFFTSTGSFKLDGCNIIGGGYYGIHISTYMCVFETCTFTGSFYRFLADNRERFYQFVNCSSDVAFMFQMFGSVPVYIERSVLSGLTICAVDSSLAYISNSKIAGLYDGGYNQVQANKSSFTLTSGVTYDTYVYLNYVTHSGSISLTNTAKGKILNCSFGVSGGTSKTVNLSAGASNNVIENCTFEIVPVDNSGNNTNTWRNNRLWNGTLLPDRIPISAIPIFPNNAAAISGGLSAGMMYRIGGDPDVLAIVH